ncbi:cell wall metabolism sensor histidine kinase WalK [Arthrobacter sp. Marseille-P9274]|uniref:sensor histidine kinase n=1 Tax=Arthrobacter sp. Marseille-P9274 TaxID=2866572 RepID=UPI0021C9A71D|nr:ATP-binding protein [Arthrobacter sp. Marseille-P9274]
MPQQAAQLPFATSFHSLGLRARVVLCQLPLFSCMLVVAAVFALAEPAMFAKPWFQLCLLLHGVLLAACAIVPWERLPVRSFQIVPVIDFALIALLMHAVDQAYSGLALLLVFPVIWLSVSVLKSRVLISFAGSLLAAVMPLLEGWALDAGHLLRLVLLPAVMLAISISVHIVANSMDSQRNQIAAKEAEVRRLLAASREREQLLHAVVDSIDVGLVALDADGRVTLANRQQGAFAVRAGGGKEAAPDLQQERQRIYDGDGVTFLPPESRPVRRAAAKQEVAGQLLWLGEEPQQIAVSATARTIDGQDEDCPSGSVVLFKDVTDQLAELAAKDDFMSGISHELRTPLTSILAYLDLALEHPDLPADVAAQLEVADRNAERLLTLISDFLSASAGTLEIRPEPADLAAVVVASVQSAAATAAAKDIALDNQVDHELVSATDPARMGQVLDNLLSNAIKYSPAGSTVTIRGWQHAGHSVLEVADTGYGMDDADRLRVFDRFFRSSSARRSGIHGTGLGLVVTKEIVERHGGTIDVSSALGEGTTFTVTVPAAAPQPRVANDGDARVQADRSPSA